MLWLKYFVSYKLECFVFVNIQFKFNSSQKCFVLFSFVGHRLIAIWLEVSQKFSRVGWRAAITGHRSLVSQVDGHFYLEISVEHWFCTTYYDIRYKIHIQMKEGFVLSS